MDLLLGGLKKTSQNPSSSVASNSEEHFVTSYRKWKFRESGTPESNYHLIPKFYSPSAARSEKTLPGKLSEVARSEFLRLQGESLLNNEELQELCIGLDEVVHLPDGQQLQHLTYAQFKDVIDGASDKLREYFKPTVIVHLLNNDKRKQRIAVADILNYSMRKTWMMQSKIGLLLYDTNGNGYFTENDMENYIAELLPTLPELERLDKTFHRFYICGAVRKFMFFLDPSRTGKIRVQDILISTFLDDILDLRDEDLPREFQETNWFSAPTALRVYGQYLYLDSDHNGMLSKEEFGRFGSGTLTSVFIDRIFQECLTYDNELDYKGYLDIVLAMENKSEPQALQFLFRLLDINRSGYLDGFCLNYFFKGIQKQMHEAGQEPVNFEDIKDELFDMIRPADPCKITMEDLVRSGQGDVMVNILTELNGFYSYENREVRPAPESVDSRCSK